MILILKRLGEATKIADIENFLEPALRGSLFKKAGWIESLTIQKIETSDQKEAEYHAIVDIRPDSAAKRAIKTLNRKQCKGKRINVAQYFLRYKLNDRRLNNQHNTQHNLRKGERRRSNLQVSDVTKQKVGSKGHDSWLDASRNINSNPFENTFKI